MLLSAILVTLAVISVHGMAIDLQAKTEEAQLSNEDNTMVQSALKDGLESTGKMAEPTEDVKNALRCGDPDLRFSADRYNRRSKRDLTYTITNYTTDMSRDDVDMEIALGFAAWARVAPLTFTHVASLPADIVLGFYAGDHGDGFPFDGPGSTAAHTFMPKDGNEIHFDDDENWVTDYVSGVNLRMIATHEIGHVLGLGHSMVNDSVMRPTFDISDAKNEDLDYDDVAGIQYLYGDDSWTAETPVIQLNTVQSTTESIDQILPDNPGETSGEPSPDPQGQSPGETVTLTAGVEYQTLIIYLPV